jgi:hypothetical protein
MRHPLLHGIDVGSPLRGGRTTRTATGLEIEAGGADIWGHRDEGHFAFTPVDGNFEASVRIHALSMADVYTKAGLMLRASLAEGSAHVMLLAFGDNQPRNHNNGGLEFQSRLTDDGACTGIYPPQPLPPQPEFPVNFPRVWLKLVRAGATFTSLASTDGLTWRKFCVHRQELPTQAYLGLAVTSHHPEQTVRAAFDPLTLAE